MAEFSGWSEFPIEKLDADLRRDGVGRPPGLHLGTIIRFKRLTEDPSLAVEMVDKQLRMQEGFLWEAAIPYMRAGITLDDALQLAWKRYVLELQRGLVTQIQLTKDGINMTPDAIDPHRGEMQCYKHTRTTLRRAIESEEFQAVHWDWMMFEKAYALAAACDTTRFVVLWAAGDYSKGPGTGPRALQATMRWTPEELVANWRDVLRWRDLMAERERGKA